MERGVAADLLQVQGVQEEEPAQRGERAHRDHRRPRERRAPEEPQVDKGLMAARLIVKQAGRRGHREDEEADDLD